MAYTKYKPENFISFEEVEKMWETSSKEKKTYLYLNNPFCQGKDGKCCKFCVYRGVTNADEKTVNDFYFDYMPKQFKKYENIIKNENFELCVFGGGTVNYLTADEFERYLESMPETIKKLPKLIEMHAAYISKEWIDVLAKYNTKHIVFCIQTFDKEILQKWNRKESVENILELIEYTNSLGINTLIDLMYFMEEENGLEALKKDIKKLESVLPTEISIAPLYQSRSKKIKSSIEIEREIEQILFVTKFSGYRHNSLSNCKVFRIYKDSQYENFHESYTRSLELDLDLARVLGIGSYKGVISDVFSVPKNGVTILEINDDNKEAKYYLLRNEDFWEKSAKLLEYLKEKFKGIEIPSNCVLKIINRIDNRDVSCAFTYEAADNITFSMSIDEKIGTTTTSINKDFVEKLDQIYSEMNKKRQEGYRQIAFLDWLEKTDKEQIGEENGICKE